MILETEIDFKTATSEELAEYILGPNKKEGTSKMEKASETPARKRTYRTKKQDPAVTPPAPTPPELPPPAPTPPELPPPAPTPPELPPPAPTPEIPQEESGEYDALIFDVFCLAVRHVLDAGGQPQRMWRALLRATEEHVAALSAYICISDQAAEAAVNLAAIAAASEVEI